MKIVDDGNDDGGDTGRKMVTASLQRAKLLIGGADGTCDFVVEADR